MNLEAEAAGKYTNSRVDLGKTDKESLRLYNAVINDFADDFGERHIKHDKLVLFYTFDSKYLSEQGSIAQMVHNNVIQTSLKELKGLVDVLVYDCSHPKFSDGSLWED